MEKKLVEAYLPFTISRAINMRIVFLSEDILRPLEVLSLLKEMRTSRDQMLGGKSKYLKVQ